jgi:hypothetical protein
MRRMFSRLGLKMKNNDFPELQICSKRNLSDTAKYKSWKKFFNLCYPEEEFESRLHGISWLHHIMRCHIIYLVDGRELSWMSRLIITFLKPAAFFQICNKTNLISISNFPRTRTLSQIKKVLRDRHVLVPRSAFFSASW